MAGRCKALLVLHPKAISTVSALINASFAVSYTHLIDRGRPDIPDDVAEQVEISIKYEGYINRQIKQAEQFRKLESKKLPEDIDYSKIDGLRIEARQKLEKIKPSSLGQASRISGVNPADIAVLMVYLKK